MTKSIFSLERDWSTSQFSDQVPTDAGEVLRYFRLRREPEFLFTAEKIPQICALVSEEDKEKTITLAEGLVRRCFQFRATETILGDPMDWAVCSQKTAPEWRSDLNRQFYFTQLGFAYWYTRDARFVRTFSELSSSWIEQHIHRLGRIAWDTPFEVAARLNAWVWAYFLFQHCEQWTASAQYRFLNALGVLAEYLSRVLEHEYLGNHLLLEAKALVEVSVLFPEFRRARHWSALAWPVLTAEMRDQVCQDGVHSERSTMYHRIVSGELAELMLVLRRNGHSGWRELAGTVARMAEFETWITCGGTAPQFNDSYCQDVYDRFSAPAVIAEDACCCSKAGKSLEQTIWAVGKGGAPSETPLLGFKAFPFGGYYVSRAQGAGGESVMVWDCGPFGYEGNPWHGHSDALSMNLTVQGVPLLIDPGTSERDPSMSDYFRSTAAHNTVVVDGESQSVLGRRNAVWRPAKARADLFGSSSSCDVMIGSHDGYRRLRGSVTHTRAIIALRGEYWVVFDYLDGKHEHRADQRFHTGRGSQVRWVAERKGYLIARGGASVLAMPAEFGGTPRILVRSVIEDGVAELEYGRCESISVISTMVTGRVPLPICMLITPKPDCWRLSRAWLVSSGLYGLEIVGRQSIDRVYVSFTGEAFTVEEYETNARILLTQRLNGGGVRLIVAGASTLRSGTRELCGALPCSVQEVLEPFATVQEDCRVQSLH